jgi:UDPglucose--hexose-1-phosphate uridylyltransferase
MNQLRRDPITGVWTIIVQDGKDVSELKPDPAHQIVRKQPEETCSYCQGRENETPSEIFAIRQGGSGRNETGWKVRVVPEKFPVLQIHGEINNRAVGIYDMHDGIGAHEVVVECPEHNRSLSELSDGEIAEVLTAYRERTLDLKRDTRFRYILAHKSYRDGSDPHARHAYGHVLATPITPQRVRDELLNAQQFFAIKDRCIFCDVIRQEVDDAQRVIAENEVFFAFCPFAARAPFEAWILPKQHETFFEWNSELPALARLLRLVLVKIRECLGDPNYVLEIHTGPNLTAGRQRGYWKTVERDFHWHIEITPRLRGYSSFEIGFGFQVNWVPPERSAELLRAIAA